MSFYGGDRTKDRATVSPTAGDYYRRRRQRRRQSLLSGPGGPTLELAADHEHLIEAYRRLEAKGGHAPGPDGVTYADLGPTEVAIVMREAAAAIRRGDYRPGPARKVAIPKSSGGTRTLTVANLIDRVVGAALAAVLTPTFETIFLPGSCGFRPGLGTWRLLADLGTTMAAHQLTTLAIDDVKKAFDNVPIAPLMEIFSEHITDTRLLHLIEAVLRGGEDRDRAVGIPQGSPLSPLALNVILHKLHDAPLAGDAASPPWFRYADNLAYACQGVPEGIEVLDHVRGLLASVGLELKGADGPPVDLRVEEAQLLGFRMTLRDDCPRLKLGGGAWTRLIEGLEEAHEEPDPPRTARTVLGGWIESGGPAFASKREVARTVNEIGRIGTAWGFRELGSTGELRGHCSMAYRRWMAYLKGASGRREDKSPLDRKYVAAPHATVETGGLMLRSPPDAGLFGDDPHNPAVFSRYGPARGDPRPAGRVESSTRRDVSRGSSDGRRTHSRPPRQSLKTSRHGA